MPAARIGSNTQRGASEGYPPTGLAKLAKIIDVLNVQKDIATRIHSSIIQEVAPEICATLHQLESRMKSLKISRLKCVTAQLFSFPDPPMPGTGIV